jgi:hypothetical protein
MRQMSKHSKISVVAAATAALPAGGGYAVAADTSTTTSDQATQGQDQVQHAPQPAPGGSAGVRVKRFDPKQAAEDRDQFYADLGEKLDKSGDEVKAAFRSLLEDQLSKEVRDGNLTEEQKDAILGDFDASLMPGPGPIAMGIAGGHGPGAPNGPPGPIGMGVPGPHGPGSPGGSGR